MNNCFGALYICHHQPQSLRPGQPEQDLVFSVACLVMKLRLIISLRNYSLYIIIIFPLQFLQSSSSPLPLCTPTTLLTFMHAISWGPFPLCLFSLPNYY